MIVRRYDIQTGEWTEIEVPDPEPIPEPDMTPRATKAIAKGEYFTLAGELCKAKVPIANGAILTLNTNYITTTVEDELSTLNQ